MFATREEEEAKAKASKYFYLQVPTDDRETSPPFLVV